MAKSRQIKVGDKVRVKNPINRKPKCVDSLYLHCEFTCEMEKYIGCEAVVVGKRDTGSFNLNIDNAIRAWHPEFLELLEEDDMSVTNVEDIQKQIAEAQKTLQELQEKLEKEKNKKWEPEGGGYYVNEYGNVAQDSQCKPYASFGVEFKTRQAAEKAAKAYRAYHRLYKLAEELNEGWEPNWDNYNEDKYIVEIINGSKATIIFDSYKNCQTLCGIYFKDRETALKAVEMIKNGALE